MYLCQGDVEPWLRCAWMGSFPALLLVCVLLVTVWVMLRVNSPTVVVWLRGEQRFLCSNSWCCYLLFGLCLKKASH